MLKNKLKNLALAVLLALSGMGQAYAAQEFLPVSDVQEGMHGYAKTVVHGRQIDTFDVEVLGILKHKGASGGDLVLVKVSGPVIDKTNGIAQGMSGSPVYINGKLLGGISYGFPQSNGRIGMVTPISDMIRLWTINDTDQNTSDHPDTNGFVALDTPLMAEGYTGSGMEFLAKKMKEFNMVPYSSVSVQNDDAPYPLEAGGSVAATLVTGDLRLGAVGTVTYVDGNHMIAFGHPFLDKGSSGYFMHNAYILTIVPSQNIPFKLGSVGAEIGVVNQDRGAGISGVSGITPDSVRLHANVLDLDLNRSTDFNVRMIQNESMLPALTATSAYNAISRTMDRKGQGTVTVNYTLFPKDLNKKAFTRSNMFWSSNEAAGKSVDEIYNVVKLLEQNRFEKYELRDINVDMKVTSERKTAQLLDASAYPMVVSPGDTIYIRVRLQPYRGEVFYKEMSFTVPADQPLGEMILEIRGGGVIPLPYLLQQQQYNLTDEVLDRVRVYKDFNDLFDKLQKEDQNNQIVAEILDPSVSTINNKTSSSKTKAEITDRDDSDVPDYLKGRKGNSADHGDMSKETAKSSVLTDYVIYGDGQFTFKVTTPEDRDRKLKVLIKNSKEKGFEKMDSSALQTSEKKASDKTSEPGSDKSAGKDKA